MLVPENESDEEYAERIHQYGKIIAPKVFWGCLNTIQMIYETSYAIKSDIWSRKEPFWFILKITAPQQKQPKSMRPAGGQRLSSGPRSKNNLIHAGCSGPQRGNRRSRNLVEFSGHIIILNF